MTSYQIGEYIGMWIGIGGIIAFVIWLIWALWKYRPFSHFVQVAYDFRYFVIQVVLMYSNRPSIFSIKRFHSGLVLYWALFTASLFIRKNEKLAATELMIIITPFLLNLVYNTYQSQQDKKIKQENGLIDKAIDKVSDIANKMEDNASNLDNKKEDKL